MTYEQRLINAGYHPSVAAAMQRVDDFLRLQLREEYTAESYARQETLDGAYPTTDCGVAFDAD